MNDIRIAEIRAEYDAIDADPNMLVRRKLRGAWAWDHADDLLAALEAARRALGPDRM